MLKKHVYMSVCMSTNSSETVCLTNFIFAGNMQYIPGGKMFYNPRSKVMVNTEVKVKPVDFYSVCSKLAIFAICIKNKSQLHKMENIMHLHITSSIFVAQKYRLSLKS